MRLISICIYLTCSFFIISCSSKTINKSTTDSYDGELSKATSLFKLEKYDESFPLSLNLAKKGDKVAQYQVGYMLLWSKVRVDSKKNSGRKWAKASALQGYEKGQYLYGFFIEHDSKTRERHKEAFSWYEKAISQGNTDAMARISYLYAMGEGGIRKDRQKAFQWLNQSVLKAEKPGYVELWGLASYYCNGKVVQQNIKTCAHYYKKSLEAGLGKDNVVFVHEYKKYRLDRFF